MSAETLERWAAAFHGLCADAVALGIPRRVLPVLQLPLEEAQLRAASTLLQGIIDSRLSSNL